MPCGTKINELSDTEEKKRVREKARRKAMSYKILSSKD